MEYILSVVWREQMAHARIFRGYSGIHFYFKAVAALEINVFLVLQNLPLFFTPLV